MAIQHSVAVRNARLDAIETTIGVSAVMRIRTGAPPADVATADAGTVLASLTLPSDYLSNAAAGVKSKLGTWSGTASAAGTAAHFRIYASNGTTAHQQGTVTATAGGGDLTVDNAVFASGQAFSISSYDLTDGNA